MSPLDPSLPGHKPGVLMIGNFLSGSVGVRCVCEDLAEGLRSRGWRVLTASSARNRVVRLIQMLVATWCKRARYAVAQIDVYADLAFVYAEVVAVSLKLLRRPFILTLHGGALSELAQTSPRRVERLLRSAAAVTAPSRHHQKGLRHLRDDIQVVRNGIDLSLYEPRVLSAARPLLVWLRAFHKTYNPVLAVEVVRLLSAEFPELRLLMVGPDKGDGTYEETTEAVTTYGLQERVRLLGAVPKVEVPRVLAEGDVFLSTTDIDNAPVTVVEALACGHCVVSTDVGGVPLLLTDGVDGLLVPPRDAAAMAAAVKRILTDASLAARLSANARTTALAFDREAVLTTWEDLLLSVSAGPPAGSWSGARQRRALC